MRTLYLVDYENVGVAGLEGVENLDVNDEVLIFCRKDHLKVINKFLEQQEIVASVSYTLVMSSSKNSLDFELIAYIGSLYDKDSLYIIISKDKGFDAAISSYQRAGFIALRKNSIDSKTFSYFLDCYKDENKIVRIK